LPFTASRAAVLADIAVPGGRPAKTIDVPADDDTTWRYCLAEWVQPAQSAAYSFLYRV
jgi:hypothetical protein